MASRAVDMGRASSQGLRESVDCPICLQMFKNPKVLICGHSLCEKCSADLINRRVPRAQMIQCPTCRRPTTVPANGLPTNFSLQAILSVMVSEEEAARLTCGNCAKKFDESEVWLCQVCSRVVLCAVCSLKNHKGHHLQEMGDLISHRQKEIDKWSEKIAPRLDDLEREDKMISGISVQVRTHQLNKLLTTGATGANHIQKLTQKVKNEYVELKKDHDVFINQKAEALHITAASVVCDVEDELTSQEIKIELLIKKQKEASKIKKDFLNILSNFETAVRNMLREGTEEGNNKRRSIQWTKKRNQEEAINRGEQSSKHGNLFPHGDYW